MFNSQSAGMNSKYLQLADLRRLQNLSFSCRRVVEGKYSGQHATRQRGQSVEFRDYRQYLPGDEIGSVDWKVFGRSDKLFIKIFEHQADLTVHLLVDASASMAYRGLKSRASAPSMIIRNRRTAPPPPPPSKFDYACSLAAGLAFLISKQKDRVSFSVARKGLYQHLPANSTAVHLVGLLKKMETINPAGSAQVPDAVRELAGKSRKRDLLILFSDLMDDSTELLNALSLWLHRGGEVILFHVLHADELKLPSIENGVFVDSESSSFVKLSVEDIRQDYDARMREFLKQWEEACSGSGIDYQLASMLQPYHETLFRYLTNRSARR